MKKKVLYGVCFILVIAIAIFINPVDFYHQLNAEETVFTIIADPTIREKIFEDASEVTGIEYLGKKCIVLKQQIKTLLSR